MSRWCAATCVTRRTIRSTPPSCCAPSSRSTTASTSRRSRCCPATATARITSCRSASSPSRIAGTAIQFGVGYGTDTAGARHRRLGKPARESRAVTASARKSKAAALAQSLDARYIVPIGDPATEKFTLQLTGEHERRADIDDQTTQFHAEPHARARLLVRRSLLAARDVRRAAAHASRSSSRRAARDQQTLLIPGISFALVPRNYLGEALFSRALVRRAARLAQPLGSDADFLQVRAAGRARFRLRERRSGTSTCAPTSAPRRCPVPATSRPRSASSPAAIAACAASGSTICRPWSRPPTRTATAVRRRRQPRLEKVGGKHLFAGSVELIRDLPWKNLAVAVFGDVGNAFDNFGDPLMYSVGVGLRLRLPVVSVGIDVAQALTIPAGQHRAPGSAPAPQFLAQVVMKRRLKIAALVLRVVRPAACCRSSPG